ncbi:hypothetical protein HHI36_015866 [Cryptolaemus montrouzieri]|uniref:Uncharacterized protein n=1 Tax=Cryptolaemus montrouzieri TaxID=559131 RepID=A0ABD2N6V8_9CUCU
MIPWLIVSAVRLCVDCLTTFAGLYICSAYGFLNTIWIEFILVQLLEHGPFFYIWWTILNYRSYLFELREKRKRLLDEKLYRIQLSRKTRRRGPRGKKNSTKSVQDRRSTASLTTITTIVDHINSKKNSLSTRSLDTLLEMIEKRKHKEESLSQTADSDDETEDGDVQSKLMKKLQLTNEDIDQAKHCKSESSSEHCDEVHIDDEIIKDHIFIRQRVRISQI